MDSTWDRTILAGLAQMTSPMTRTVVARLRPRKTARTMSSGRNGRASVASTRRISRLSIQPPKNPEITPSRPPTTMASVAARKPMASEIRAP